MKQYYSFFNFMERKYILNKTLFVNKVSTSFNFFQNVAFKVNLFEKIVYSILVESYVSFFTKFRKQYGIISKASKDSYDCWRAHLHFYGFNFNVTYKNYLQLLLFSSFNQHLIVFNNYKQQKTFLLKSSSIYQNTNKYPFYRQSFLYRNDLIFSILSKNYFTFVSKFLKTKTFNNFFEKFFFDFNKNVQRIVMRSFDDNVSQNKFSEFLFNKFIFKKTLAVELNLLLKNYKYLNFGFKDLDKKGVIKKNLVLGFFEKVSVLFKKYGQKRNYSFFLAKIKYIFFLKKNYNFFFKKNMHSKLNFFKKFNGFFKPLLKQYYKRYGRRYKRRFRGRLRLWHFFFLRNRKRKKRKKVNLLGHRKRFESWLIKTKKFINLRQQVFHKQVFKYNFLSNINISQFKDYFKLKKLSNNLIWNTFRLRIYRFGPNTMVKNFVRYNKYNLINNLYLKKKIVKGRLANFFWRRSSYIKKNFFSNVERYYKRMINFALDCLAPAGFMGAFRVKRQKKVLKRSFITKNYRRYFLGAKLLISLSKKNKRMADVEKLAFRIWHLWRFVNCGKKPKYFSDTLQKYYKPFSSVKSNQRLWKWRYMSDRGTIFKYFYW